MTYQVKLEHFEGPLDLLLQLIESESLPVNKVSLSAVAEQFIAYLNQIEERRPEELVEFLSVAARLMLIKSRTLVPHLAWDDDGDGAALERQLRLYQQFVVAARQVEDRWQTQASMASRSKLLLTQAAQSFYPPEQITLADVGTAFRRWLSALIIEPARAAQQRIERTISLKEKILHIRHLVYDKLVVGFRTLLGDRKSKTEIIVTFLALLELVKQKVVQLSQSERFEDITIHKSE